MSEGMAELMGVKLRDLRLAAAPVEHQGVPGARKPAILADPQPQFVTLLVTTAYAQIAI